MREDPFEHFNKMFEHMNKMMESGFTGAYKYR